MTTNLLNNIIKLTKFCLIYFTIKIFETIITMLLIFKGHFTSDFSFIIFIFINAIFYIYYGYYLSKHKNINLYYLPIILIIGLLTYIIPYILTGKNFYIEEYLYIHIPSNIFIGNYFFNSYIYLFLKNKINSYFIKDFLVLIISILYTLLLLLLGNKIYKIMAKS